MSLSGLARRPRPTQKLKGKISCLQRPQRLDISGNLLACATSAVQGGEGRITVYDLDLDLEEEEEPCKLSCTSVAYHVHTWKRLKICSAAGLVAGTTQFRRVEIVDYVNGAHVQSLCFSHNFAIGLAWNVVAGESSGAHLHVGLCDGSVYLVDAKHFTPSTRHCGPLPALFPRSLLQIIPALDPWQESFGHWASVLESFSSHVNNDSCSSSVLLDLISMLIERHGHITAISEALVRTRDRILVEEKFKSKKLRC